MIKKKQEQAIRTLASLMNELGLSEITVHQGEERVHVAKHTAPLPHASTSASSSSSASSQNAEEENNLVSSPMVGVAYLCPAPQKPPFVKAGDKIIKGQNLLIIEAMKSMNYITAHESGVVEKIVVENEQPVEYGTPLIYIKPLS